MTKIKSKIFQHLFNIPGWNTDRKIVVIESDDWGMIRMASKKAFSSFLRKGYRVDKCPINSNDALESNDDLEKLMNVLGKVKDSRGNPAKFTLNNVMTNPDFEKIKSNDFQQYVFQPFYETLKQYENRDRVLSLYKKGMEAKVFQLQFHGREHINVARWMQRLQEGEEKTKVAFDHNMVAVNKEGRSSGRRDALDTFGKKSKQNSFISFDKSISEGLQIFKGIWGFTSLSFIAPCYVWHPNIEPVLAENGIRYIQGTRVQRIPKDDDSLALNKKYHYTGQKNGNGQFYLNRNVIFEPTVRGQNHSVENALKEIDLAFKYRKPAVICSHRVNYIGSIRPENREKNLKLLSMLLTRIVRKWPEVEFMSSDQLGNLILKG